MNLKKLFWFELITGIVLSILPIIAFLSQLEFLKTRESNLFILSLFAVARSTIYNKSIQKNVREWGELKKVGIGTLIIIGVFVLIHLVNKQYFNLILGNFVGQYWAFYFLSLFLLIHSTLGFITIKRNPLNTDESDKNKQTDDDTKKPEYLTILNYNSLFLIIICGIGIFAFCLLGASEKGSSLSEALMAPGYLIIVLSLVTFINSKIHNMRILDERERFIIFKITSVAAFLGVITLLILFAFRSTNIFGFFINDIWGLAIVPIGMVLWGITGFFVLAKEEGGVIRVLRNK